MAIPLSAPLAAQIIQGTPGRIMRGTGTVEAKLDRSTYVIKLDTSRITVTVTEGDLEVNTPVHVTQSGEKLTIRPLAVPPQTAHSPATLISLTAPTSLPESPPAVPLNSVVLREGVSTGLHVFNSTATAGAWLTEQGADSEEAAQAVKRLDQNTPILIRVNRSEHGAPEAVVLTGEKARTEIQHFKSAELQSPVWKEIPPSLLLEQIAVRGSVSLERLLMLDRALAAVPGSEKGSSRIANQSEAVLRQWLATALDPLVDPEAAAQRIPLRTAAEIITDLRQMIPAGSGLPAVEEAVLASKTDKGAALLNVFKSLGLNFEAIMAGNTPDADALQSVKSQLYRALAAIGPDPAQTATGTKPAAGTDTPVLQQQMQTIVQDITHLSENLEQRIKATGSDLSLLLRRVSDSITARLSAMHLPADTSLSAPRLSPQTFTMILEKIPADASTLIETGSRMVAQQAAGLTETIATDANRLKQSLQNINHPAGQTSGAAANALNTLSAMLSALPDDQSTRNITSGTAQPNTLSHALIPAANTLAAAGELLRRLNSDINAAIRQTIDSLTLGATPGGTPADATLSREQTAAALSRLSARIMDVFLSLDRQLQELFSGATREQRALFSRLAQESHALLEQILRDTPSTSSAQKMPDAANPAEPPLVQNLKQQMEHSLARLESLQLLARPTATAETQQQILALPIRIDGELTEVRIQLIKKEEKGKQSKKGPKQYSVAISIAPSASGEIAIAMDYIPKHPLTVRMTFDSPRTRSWFEQHREELTRTLQGVGFPGVNLSVALAPDSIRTDKKNPASGVLPKTTDSRIDMHI